MHCDRWKKRKITIVMICVCLFWTVGCGGADTKKGSEDAKSDPGTGGVGRYMEDIREIPEKINRNGGMNMLSDGSMTVISFNGGLFRSTDQGVSWQQEDTPWFPMMQDVYALAAVMAPDGTAAISCSGKMPQAARDALSSPLPDDWEGNYCIFAFPGGEISVVDFGFTQEDGSCISSFAFREDGRLFAGDMNGKIYEVDMEHESVKELFMMEQEAGCIGFCGDILLAVGSDRLYLYDPEKMEPLPQDAAADDFIKRLLSDGTVRYTGGGYPLAVFGGEDNIIYIACVEGLYRHVLGGSAMEQIIDGALSTFGDNGSIYAARTLDEQEFLVQFDHVGGLVRYYFDETAASMPDKEIKIYSLEENRSVRQAVTSFKKSHTDMYVRYETGLDGEGGTTREDAVKQLNTRILSGEGPDVIILDGLPIDSYIEKGLLADLSEVMEAQEGEGELFSNLTESFRGEDGRLYAIPLCIQVPLLAGEYDVINGMEDLESFADAMERLRAENPEGGLLGIYDADAMLRLFGMVSSSAWTDEAGQIDKEAVEAFLTQMKRIYDAEYAGALPEEIEALQEEDDELMQYGFDPSKQKMEACNNVLNIRRGYAKLACGYVDGIQICLDNVTSVIDLEENMGYRNFSGQAQNVFIPKVMAGMSAKSAEPEAAEEFIKTMFSPEVQKNIYEGFPVNRAAFADWFDFLEPDEENGSMTMINSDGSEEELVLHWPDQAEEADFTGLVQRLSVPAAEEEQLSELVYEAGVKVLEDEVSAEEAADEIVKKAAIYLAE